MTEPAKKYDSSDFQESHFGIRNKQDLVHIFNVMRNKIYTNKTLAVLREYSTNAMDEHIESGQKDRPIEVTMPTATNPILKIRDYGRGLSEEDIRNTYTMYGASTKRGSSELNGQLGFGSKAAFSYADEYTIVSHHDGKETIYEAYVDETGLGAISKLSEKPSTSTGIEIRIRVQLHDIAVFNSTARELYKYFTVTPIVNNLQGKIDKYSYSFSGKDWGLRNNTTAGYGAQGSLVAIMGNVGYPLSNHVLQANLRNYAQWKTIEPLLACNLDLRFKVGDLSIAASREGLEYDKKTLKAIQDALENAFKDISDIFNKKLEAAKDIVEAKRLYRTVMYGDLAPLARALTSTGIKWNGKKIDDWRFSLPVATYDTVNKNKEAIEVPGYTLKKITANSYANSGIRVINLQHGSYIELSENTKLFYRDTDEKPMLRVRKYLEDHPQHEVLLFENVDPEYKITGFLSALSVPEKYSTALSTQEALKIESEKKVNPNASKHAQKVFRLAERTGSSGYADSSYWDTVEIDPEEEYYYIYLDRFQPAFEADGSCYTSNTTFRALLEGYTTITGNSLNTKIIGIKRSAAKKVKSNWKPLLPTLVSALDGVAERVKPAIENEAIITALNGSTILNSLNRYGNLIRNPNQLNQDSMFRQFCERYNTARNTPSSTAQANLFNAYTTMRTNLDSIRRTNANNSVIDNLRREAQTAATSRIQQLNTRYPLLQYIYAYTVNSHLESAITEYIRLVDRQHSQQT